MASTPVTKDGSIQDRHIQRLEILQRMAEYERLNYPKIIKRQRREIRHLEKEIRCLRKSSQQR